METVDFFHRFARGASSFLGSSYTFIVAVLTIIVWALVGPLYGFSDTWQLVINTGTTIVTFLLAFLIQNTQNRDNRATQLKLDEIVRSIKQARNSMLNVEDLSDEELDRLHEEFHRIREDAKRKGKGQADE
jgi:low affinity Fe/Cu permease